MRSLRRSLSRGTTRTEAHASGLRRCVALFWAVLGAATFPALTVEVCAEEPTPVRSFRPFDKQRSPGLPQSTVMDLLQDDAGVLWIATLGGLGTFDGTTIRPAPGGADAPDYGALYALARSGSSGIWVGGASAVWRWDGKSWAQLPAPGGASSLAEDGLGRLWRVDPAGGLWLLPNRPDAVLASIGDEPETIWQRVETAGWMGPAVVVHAPPRSLQRPTEETGVDVRVGPKLWLAGQDGVGMLLSGDVDFEPVASGAAPAPGVAITAMLPARSGLCWVATADGELHHTTPEGWRSVEMPGWDGGRIRALEEDLRGRIWAGGLSGGVAHGRAGGEWTVWGPENGLRSEGTVALLADREGSLWISANGYGLQQWIGEAWSHRNTWTDTASRHHETRQQIFGITPSLDGRGFYAAVFSQGIWHWDGERMRAYGEADGLEEDVRSAFEPEPGVLWVAARSGLYERRPGDRRFRWVARVPSGFVYGVVRAPDDVYWAHTSAHGVLRRGDDGAWTLAEDVNRHLEDRNVKALLFPSGTSGEIWLGTLDGLVVVRDGKAVVLSADLATALPSAVQALHEVEPTGDVWVAGFGGVSRIPGGDLDADVETLTLADGLPGHTVYSLASVPSDGDNGDGGGELWIGGSNGVGRMPLRPSPAGRQITVYDSTDGLIEDECNHLGLWPAPDGSIYVGTMASLARFDPVIDDPPPADLRLRWTRRPPAGELPSDHRSVRLAWHAPWLAPDVVEYRTRVPRLSTDWSASTTRGALELENLGPGTWTVEVQARLGGIGDWVSTATTFSIAPYFHETRGFWLLCALLASLVVVAFVRWRTRRLRRRAAELQAAVDQALARIKVLGGLLPICAGCKKVRDDAGYWQQIESYLHVHSEAELSHGMCPDCASELYGAYVDTDTDTVRETADAG